MKKKKNHKNKFEVTKAQLKWIKALLKFCEEVLYTVLIIISLSKFVDRSQGAIIFTPQEGISISLNEEEIKDLLEKTIILN